MKKLTSDLINIPGFEKLQPSDATSDATSDVTDWEMIDQLLSEVATYTIHAYLWAVYGVLLH